jgi:hypothetical protein
MKQFPLSAMGKTLFAIASVSVLAGCIEKEKIAKIGDAENILITEAGAVLVTGGDSVVGIIDDGAGLGATQSLIHNPGACTGMAQSGDDVFVVCSKPYIKFKNWMFKAGNDTRLFHAKDTQDPRDMEFTLIDHPEAGEGVLDTMVIPNGMAFSPTGDLLIANYNLLGQGSLGKVTLSYSGESASIESFNKNWLDSDIGLTNPNGVRVDGNKLYVSDNNKVRRLYFNDYGDVPYSVQLDSGEWVSNEAPANEVYNAGSLAIIDDIMPYCNGIALTSYVDGKLIFVDEDGKDLQTLAASFSFPSSLAIAKGPLFNDHTLLVTEKGILQERASNIGNRLSAVPTDLNLHDPATCDALKAL